MYEAMKQRIGSPVQDCVIHGLGPGMLLEFQKAFRKPRNILTVDYLTLHGKPFGIPL